MNCDRSRGAWTKGDDEPPAPAGLHSLRLCERRSPEARGVARAREAHAHKSSAGADKRVYRPATFSSARDGKGNVGPRLERALRSARHEHPARRSPPGPGAGNGSCSSAGDCAISSQDLTAAPARSRRLRERATTEHETSGRGRARAIASVRDAREGGQGPVMGMTVVCGRG